MPKLSARRGTDFQTFKSFSFRMFAQCRGMRKDGYRKYKRDIEGYLRDIGTKGSEWRAMEEVEQLYPNIAEQYFDFSGKQNKGGAEQNGNSVLSPMLCQLPTT